MKKYNVELLPAAYGDLDEIFDYIMPDSLQAANDTLDNIMNSLRRLEDFPQSGVPLIDRSMKKFNFKMIIINPYIVFYRFIDGKVIIYRILHCARNYPHLLKEDMKKM
ncbi:MAG: type II toxin-antitoxin system RelE/ParE family toxin [Actinomycetia bacterium]|nr:type II toxin-antitoxin system RelE/ParE family toxin [Actinomycetes bacterium]